MTASPIKTVFTLLVCSLMVLNNPGAAQACWLTDWLWGNNTEAYPVQPPVITTNYPVYPTTVGYAPAQGACQPSVVGSYPGTTVGYTPMNYESQYQQVPVTVYRPTTVYQPTTGGVPAVGYQGCTTSRYQVQRIPACGYAPTAQSSCGCSSAGYNVPSATMPGTTIQQGQPSEWVPRDQVPAGGYQQQAPVQVPAPPSSVPPAGSTYGGGSSYTQPPTQQSLGPQPGSRYGTEQPMSPADTQPALRPGYEEQGVQLNGSMSAPRVSPSPSAPISRYVPPSVTSQRPAATTVTPSSSSNSTPVTNPWQGAPVNPIPDPQFSNTESSREAPRLLDPRDKTAGLDSSSLIVPVGYQMETQPPQRTYRPPTASIQTDANGWYSPGK
ncbi:hypothetical protein DTL21_24770 [Bremerella cremea]|uniref:Uncharacterized protein n=1 Tax=Blastopirellula marina TaxID=124 RepID=A0A2S8FAX7_9BACT|nr:MULTISPECIES: hypothetical protein [Pirellulaceae]PQO29292.1 hypothetical protein C5Y83_24725 [Blastopirellula marina]RCS42596.1 hypothetical protein DTL21_24770 [Bremerella cremea]